MAAKVLLCIAVLAAVAYASDSGCDCSETLTEKENIDHWAFLKQLSELANPEDPDNEHWDAVLPGELSPPLECNCLEKTRRKRKILPEVVEATQDSDYSDEPLGELTRSPKCSEGFVLWFRVRCVPEKILMEK